MINLLMPFASATNKIWQQLKQDVIGDVSGRSAKLDLILLRLFVSQLKKIILFIIMPVLMV